MFARPATICHRSISLKKMQLTFWKQSTQYSDKCMTSRSFTSDKIHDFSSIGRSFFFLFFVGILMFICTSSWAKNSRGSDFVPDCTLSEWVTLTPDLRFKPMIHWYTCYIAAYLTWSRSVCYVYHTPLNLNQLKEAAQVGFKSRYWLNCHFCFFNF